MNINRQDSIIKKYYSWVPDNWDLKLVEDISISAFTNGVFNDPKKVGKGCKLINVVDLYSEPHIKTENLARLDVNERELNRFKVDFGDLFFTRSSLKLEGIAHCNINVKDQEDLVYDCHIMRLRPDMKQINPFFLRYFCIAYPARKFFMSHSRTTTMTTISQEDMKGFRVPVPPLAEQEKIAEVLGCWDLGIERLEKLIEAKRKMKRGLSQQLLTGKKRFKKFIKSSEFCNYHFYELPKDWKNVKVSDIAIEIKKRHDGSGVVVLSCSKYDGLVNSLDYFGKKVYSDDTSNYKTVKRNQFAYPSNHIEEGSIGLLRHIAAGIVSPIYTVFKTNEKVDPDFMYAVFKTELYKHIFKVNTNASVDRRGSLRWREFSNIYVPLPSIEEQQKIASVLNTADREIELLCDKLQALKNQKKGLMQKLLTGKIRVKV